MKETSQETLPSMSKMNLGEHVAPPQRHYPMDDG